ncbi:response regulator transcription factor, partial [Candidatus Azambacteria bacterium]|nr:response regulator transcription factor [Candidatus Azambacteria bacterium]
TPIIILSNLGQKDDIEKGLRLGATDYLVKAHNTPGEIIDKVKAVLAKAY